MTTEPSLPRLIQSVQAGDVEAFAEVIRLHERPVRGWIVSRCPPGADADDVAQRTFIEAFKQIDQYEGGTNFRAWLFAIARYQLMAECTRLKRLADYHSRYVPVALAEELAKRSETVSELEEQRLTHLRTCLEAIEEKGRELISWRYEKEIPLEEMAQRTGRTVSAIKKHLYTLRQSLHDCIQRKLASEAT